MQTQEKQVSAIILLEMENVMMHRFVKGDKSLFTSGNCKLAKVQNANSNTVYFMNINSFYYTLSKAIVFIRLQYPETLSYLFPHFDYGMSAITLPLNSPHAGSLQTILQNSAVLTSYDTAIQDPNLRDRIQQHCPNVLVEQINCPDKVKQAITKSGRYLGYAFSVIGNFVSKGVSSTGQFIHRHLNEGHTQIQPSTKEKWEEVKQGTNKAFTFSMNLLTSITTPVIQKGKEVTDSISSSINKSENPSVVYARELAQTSGKAINEAFEGLSVGAKQVAGEFGTQGKKIITKKFGEDALNTFTGASNQQSNQLKQPLIQTSNDKTQKTQKAQKDQKDQKDKKDQKDQKDKKDQKDQKDQKKSKEPEQQIKKTQKNDANTSNDDLYPKLDEKKQDSH